MALDLLYLIQACGVCFQVTSTTALLTAPPPGPAKRERKKRIEDRDEGYDTTDPFVDDSEIALDMPKYYVRPSRDGFYVSQGLLELLTEGPKCVSLLQWTIPVS